MTDPHEPYPGYWHEVWRQFRKQKLSSFALLVVCLFFLMAVYAPFLASSKPLAVNWNGTWFFPLFRYLFYTGFYTKGIDLFFNLLMFTFPLFLLAWFLCRRDPRKQGIVFVGFTIVQIVGFFLLYLFVVKDPAHDVRKRRQYQEQVAEEMRKASSALSFVPYVPLYRWDRELEGMNDYAKLNLLLRYRLQKAQDERWQQLILPYAQQQEMRWLQRKRMEERRRLSKEGVSLAEQPSDAELTKQLLMGLSEQEREMFQKIPTPYARQQQNKEKLLQQYAQQLQDLEKEYGEAKKTTQFFQNICYRDEWNLRCQFLEFFSPERRREIETDFLTVNRYESIGAKQQYLLNRAQWLEKESADLSVIVYPLLRFFHWEDDAGGGESMNRLANFWELTRPNGKDLTAALIFGARISLLVGATAVGIALLIGIPLGAIGGFFGGKTDMIVYRFIEIWESMPVFFMLLFVVGILQTKSIFIIILVIGLFGWTSFSRYIRAEFFKQRSLPYVEACRMQGFSKRHVMFSHILPNALPPVLTLLPFAVMAAITSEAGLSFLGLGEEGSASWGVLMDEGRSAFPGESYLLWPPAIFLTTLLIAIALVGDGLRDALDPKMHR